MAEDKVEIVGRWRVSFKKWIWEYVFSTDGSVRWSDPLNNENGKGRWALTPATVYISWSGSTTKESWNRPVKQQGQSGYVDADYGKGSLAAEKVRDVVLPDASGSTDTIDLEIDPATGEFVQTDPQKHPKFIEHAFDAVAYGILPDGYYIFCTGMDLPILLPESMVDFELGSAERERSKIFDTIESAKSAARDSPGSRRVAYFWGAGGAVVSPTVIGPATTPQLYSSIIEVRSLRDKFVSVMLPAITMAIGMISGPKPTAVKGTQRGGRIAKRRGANVPPRNNPPSKPGAVPPKIKPLNGQVSVGGGFENKNGTNLNPLTHDVSGGPAKPPPNHVLGRMENMADKFESGSVQTMISSRLRFVDVDWTKGPQAASKVMAPGGKVAMNIWCQGAQEQEALKTAFKGAGFKNVKVLGDGTVTMLFADF